MSTTQQTGDASPEEQFEKRVQVLEKDEDEQVATAAALVPDRLDHQGDFLRAETIADLADGYADRFEAGEVYPGVMHSVFPDEGVTLVESRVLEDAETIGEKDLAAGSWVQSYKFEDEALWELVDDGVLGGVSIGGTAKGIIYEPGAMPDDVEIPDPVQERLDELELDRDDIMVREITDGRILETSQVDYPAVPDAVHADVKALAKGAPALTENVVAARLYLEARGHDERNARRLAEYLQDQKSSGGLLDRARKMFGWGAGSEKSRPGVAETPDEDPRSDGQASDERAESRAGSSGSTTNMSDDELNEKLEALDARLDSIDEKISEAAEGAEPESDPEKTENEGDEGDPGEPSVDEKVDRIAEATVRLSETVEQMASAQGVSQQADQGNGANESEKLWGDGSPFGPRGGN